MAMAAQDRLLFVADAIKNNGQGTVYVYHLHNATEYVAGFETAVAVSSGQVYDFVGSLIKSNAVRLPRAAARFGVADGPGLPRRRWRISRPASW